jgi:AcrR family transcriptional regulator
VLAYTRDVPKLWSNTIEVHRREVTDAILNAAALLVAEHGLASVTMSQIAETTGIGRATLYKYFPDIDAILTAWHERHVTEHLARLVALSEQPGTATERLEAVLHAFAMISRQRQDTELAAMEHRGPHVAHAQQRLLELVRDLVSEGAKQKQLRDDVSPKELASYCLHALTAASSLTSIPAVERLVKVTLTGLQRE